MALVRIYSWMQLIISWAQNVPRDLQMVSKYTWKNHDLQLPWSGSFQQSPSSLIQLLLKGKMAHHTLSCACDPCWPAAPNLCFWWQILLDIARLQHNSGYQHVELLSKNTMLFMQYTVQLIIKLFWKVCSTQGKYTLTSNMYTNCLHLKWWLFA